MKLIPRQSTFHFQGEFRLILQTISSRNWRCGKALSELEQRFARYIGCKHAILIPSVTFGMYQILKTLLDKEDEVICPAFSHNSIPEAILLAGGRPVFVDVSYQTFNIDVKQIENKLTDKTKVIIVLHFGGQLADLDFILKIAQRHNLFVISDCAHACGAEYKGKKVGSIEGAACFSFGTGKNVDGFGGGILTTNNDFIARNIREAVGSLCRWPTLWGLTIKVARAYIQWLLMKPLFFHFFTFPLIWISGLINRETDILYEIANTSNKKISHNLSIKDKVRFSNLQAMIVLKHLDLLDIRNEKTRNNAYFLSKQLSGIDNIKLPLQLPETKPVFLLYTIKVQDKWNLSFELFKRGIDTRKKYFGNPCTNLQAFKKFRADCPNAQELLREQLYLPIYATLNRDAIMRIVDCIRVITSRG